MVAKHYAYEFRDFRKFYNNPSDDIHIQSRMSARVYLPAGILMAFDKKTDRDAWVKDILDRRKVEGYFLPRIPVSRRDIDRAYGRVRWEYISNGMYTLA